MKLRNATHGISALSVVLVMGLVFILGAYAYDYLIEKPPTALIKLFTKTEPPPPLPDSVRAPLDTPEGFERSFSLAILKVHAS